jgi:hypothetical protein
MHFKHLLGMTTALALSASALAANVRVAHLSPDAPPVDVLVNGSAAFSDLPFGGFTAYADLPAGEYEIQVVAAGTSGPAVIDTVVTLPQSGDFTIAAINTLKNITPAIFEDENIRIPGMTRVRFLHASPDTPAVDIAVTDGPVLFANVSFGASGGYVDVPEGIYDLEARLANTDVVALSLPDVALEGGTVVSVWASGLLNGDPPLGVAVSLDLAPQAKLRVIHASPDAPAVDVKLNKVRAITNLSFNEATQYAMVDPGQYNVQVVPAGADDPVVIDADLELAVADYTVIASNTLDSITPIVLVDDNTLSDLARIRFIHASPDAPAVDIAVSNGGPVLFADIEFGESGGYIEVPGGIYDLEARVAGTDTVALSVPGVSVTGNRNFTILATGLLGSDPQLGVLATLDAERCATDVVGNGQTDVNDILALIDRFGSNDPWADVNDTGLVDIDDIMAVLMNYGRCN